MIINPEKDAIIKAINNLYILNRYRYLILNPKSDHYFRVSYYIGHPEKSTKGAVVLSDFRLYNHINGKETLGVFARKMKGVEDSKFITFDVDIGQKDKNDKVEKKKNIEKAKWVVYKIVNVLQDIGISSEYYRTSFSGGKGYHVEIFFDAPIEISLLKRFHKYVLDREDLKEKEDLIIDEVNYGKVEFRPTYDLGVKIPLGYNFNNKTDPTNNYCYFCDYEKGLIQIKDPLYITKIKRMDNILFRLILDKIFDTGDEDICDKNIIAYKETKDAHKTLKIYDLNVDPDATKEAIEELIEKGLTRTGTRNSSLMKIAKYYKHLEVSPEDNKEWITEWMHQQDKACYTTKWNEVLKDIDGIIKYVYSHVCALVGGVNKVIITYAEIKEILKAKSKNEKLILYSMLIHSKRYSTKIRSVLFPL